MTAAQTASAQPFPALPAPPPPSADPPTGTHVNLLKNSRPGLGACITAQRPGLPCGNLQNALGFPASVRPTRVGSRCSGKERDQETGLDYFGARYFSGAQGRFTSPDLPLLASLENPQTWNLYSYTANNPLSRIDPDGWNWFQINGNWEWHEGDTYDPDGEKEKKKPIKSNYTHLLVFQQTGTNRSGAATGTLTLYDQNKVIAISPAFSGGAEDKGPIAGGTFMIRPGLRDTADVSDLTILPGGGGAQLRNFYGIQSIPADVGGYDVRYEWGSIRAKLNEPRGETRPDFLGQYLHGKTRPGDYTHGCICERSERILRLIEQLDYRHTPAVPVWVRRR